MKQKALENVIVGFTVLFCVLLIAMLTCIPFKAIPFSLAIASVVCGTYVSKVGYDNVNYANTQDFLEGFFVILWVWCSVDLISCATIMHFYEVSWDILFTILAALWLILVEIINIYFAKAAKESNSFLRYPLYATALAIALGIINLVSGL